MDRKRRFTLAPLALGGIALIGAGSVAGVTGLDAERLVTAAFDRAFEVDGHKQRIAAAQRPNTRAYDGLAGSESFWLGLANPDVARTVAVGQPLFLRAAAGHTSRRLIVTEVRELARSGNAGETHIDTRGEHAGGSYVIVGRDAADPASGEFHIMVRNGELSLVKAPEHQSL